MTVEIWQQCLAKYAYSGNRTEALMAQMLLDLSTIEDREIERVFDRYASVVLERLP